MDNLLKDHRYLRSVPSVLRTPCSLCCAFSCRCPSCVFSNLQPLCCLFALFCAPVPFVFSNFQPLFGKHPGWGWVLLFLATRHSPLHCAACESTQCLIYGSRRLSGTAPCSRTASWKVRMLNLAPRRRSASARSSRILSWPSL